MKNQAEPSMGSVLTTLLSNRVYLIATFAHLTALGYLFVAATWLPSYVNRNFDLSFAEIGLFLAVSTLLGSCMGTLFSGRDRRQDVQARCQMARRTSCDLPFASGANCSHRLLNLEFDSALRVCGCYQGIDGRVFRAKLLHCPLRHPFKHARIGGGDQDHDCNRHWRGDLPM